MSILSQSAKLVARSYAQKFKRWERNAVALQKQVFSDLLKRGARTKFGNDHKFKAIKSHKDFVDRVPIRDYENIKPYIDLVIAGQKDILWPGRPKYFAKSSGTTSGTKYIPITQDSIPNHIGSARLALLMYIHKTGNTAFVDGKYIFISGSPVLENSNGILTGRLSGIVNHHVPWYVKRNQLPTFKTNCIGDWESKLDSIVKETIHQRMSIISGIPPWVEMYFERLLAASGKKTISDIFPNFQLFVYGGVNFRPYEERFKKLIGRDIGHIETYPASEGFIAFQDEYPSQGLILIPDSGIFYEFVPTDRFDEPNPPRFTLEEVELNKNYAIILSTNAGLWAYSIGDTVRFVSKNPYRLVVTGRLKHFISAFGEHVIAEEVESALNEACQKFNAQAIEFTVAPLVSNPNGLPCHEWFVEFSKPPNDLNEFRLYLDLQMQDKNIYYRDLVNGSILQPLIINLMPKGSFIRYMKSIGKLGGQNKVPHLKNDRSIADELTKYLPNQ